MVWRWGLGRGYFRRAVTMLMIVVLAGSLVGVITFQRTLRPVIFNATAPELPLEKRLLVTRDTSNDQALGDWVVFAALCDSCIYRASLRLSESYTDTCAQAVRLYREVQAQLARELNRYNWSATRFRTCAALALWLVKDTIPTNLRALFRCKLLCPIQATNTNFQIDTITKEYLCRLLDGRIWWLQIGLAELTEDTTYNRAK